MKDIQPIIGLDLRLTDDRWEFAENEKERIAIHWESTIANNPRIWNGGLLICSHAEVVDQILYGRFLKTDYASYIAWNKWGNPGPQVYSCFGVAVVRASGGALLYGRMAAHTLNAGRVHPPGGTLDLDNVLPDGRVDVLGSIVRELKEETGLEAMDALDSGLLLVQDGPRIVIAQLYDFPLDPVSLTAKVNAYLAKPTDDELEGVEMISSQSQIDGRMFPFAARLARNLLPK